MAAVLHEPPRERLSIALGAAIALHVACALFGYRVAKNEDLPALTTEPLPSTEIEVFEVEAAPAQSAVDTDETPSGQVALNTARSAVRAERRGEAGPSDTRESPQPPAVSSNPSVDSDGHVRDDGYALDPSAAANRAPAP